MKPCILLITLFSCCLGFRSFAQTNSKKNAIGISIPVIRNSSDAKVGASGNPSGSAISYGINLNYSRIILNKIAGVTGIGFLKQRFGAPRFYRLPGVQDDLGRITRPVYDNICLRFGLAYCGRTKDSLSLKGAVYFNKLYSYRQTYNQLKKDMTHNWMLLGESINLSFGLEQKLLRNFFITEEIVFPVIVHWSTDKAFGEDPQIARNIYSAGIEISCKYHF